MSFSLPKNIPRFDDQQRNYENVYWSQAQNGRGLSNAVGSFFESKELPMYKDKPYNYPPSTKRPPWGRKRLLAIAILILVILLWQHFTARNGKRAGILRWSSWLRPSRIDWQRRTEDVRAALELSWDGYERFAFGMDDSHSIARTSGTQVVGPGLGYIIANALDTLIIMNSTSRLTQARKWVMEFEPSASDAEVSTFEATSHVLGGHLSAHYLSTQMPELARPEEENVEDGEDLYIEKATELADALIGAYADSQSGVPFSHIHLHTRKGVASKANGGATLTAHAAGMQLELRYIAMLLGEKLFWEVTEKCSQSIDSQADPHGLVSDLVMPKTGEFVHPTQVQLNNLTIPYYEILLKQYLQTWQQEPLYRDMWMKALSSIRKRITYTRTAGLPILGEGADDSMSVTVDEAICKIPGLVALSATGGRTLKQAKNSKSWTRERDNEIAFSQALMRSCWGLYKASPHKLAPAKLYLKTTSKPLPEALEKESNKDIDPGFEMDISVDPSSAHKYQDSSFVESLFYLWRITEEDKYRDWGWEVFTAYINTTLAPGSDGYVAFSDDSNTSQLDVMNGLGWLSRTLKFLYLLFGPIELLPLDKVIFTSAGHVFPRLKLTRGFKTGWQRKARNQKSPENLPPGK